MRKFIPLVFLLSSCNFEKTRVPYFHVTMVVQDGKNFFECWKFTPMFIEGRSERLMISSDYKEINEFCEKQRNGK